MTNPASNEPLLNALAEEFISSGYRHEASRPADLYEHDLSARRSHPNEFNLSRRRKTTHGFTRNGCPAEVLLDAIDAVTGVPTGFSGLPAGTRAVQLPDEDYSNEFLKLFGRPPRESACECERSPEPSLSQSLHVMNDDFVLGKFSSAKGYAAELAGDERPAAKRVRELFLRVWTRLPGTVKCNRHWSSCSHRTIPRKDGAICFGLW